MLHKNPTSVELRVFAGGLMILAGIVLQAGSSWFPDSWQVGIAGVLAVCGLLGLFRPMQVRKVYDAWMLAVTPIGWLISHLAMAAIFFLVMTPIGLLRRLLGADPLNIRDPNSSETYWELIQRDDDPSRSFRQY